MSIFIHEGIHPQNIIFLIDSGEKKLFSCSIFSLTVSFMISDVVQVAVPTIALPY